MATRKNTGKKTLSSKEIISQLDSLLDTVIGKTKMALKAEKTAEKEIDNKIKGFIRNFGKKYSALAGKYYDITGNSRLAVPLVDCTQVGIVCEYEPFLSIQRDEDGDLEIAMYESACRKNVLFDSLSNDKGIHHYDGWGWTRSPWNRDKVISALEFIKSGGFEKEFVKVLTFGIKGIIKMNDSRNALAKRCKKL